MSRDGQRKGCSGYVQDIVIAADSKCALDCSRLCTIDNRVTRVAWLNRSTILYAGNDKWCLDPRVVLLSNTQTQYSIEIQNVDVYDEGPYTCSVQTDNHPKTSRVHLIVQGLLGNGQSSGSSSGLKAGIFLS
ncbi:hypothetical protein K5549_007696 [Capra hircus]|nr:hypothetical protein K5549_007696 [Capra hircus]